MAFQTPIPSIMGFVDTAANIAAFTATADYKHQLLPTSDAAELWYVREDLVKVDLLASSSFDFSGDTGGAQTIDPGNSMTFTGGDLLTTVSSATDTLSINFDTTGATNGMVPKWDGTNVTWSAPITIAAGSTSHLNLTAAGELSVTALAVNDVRTTTTADLAAFVAAEYTAGTEFQEGDIIIIPADGTSYIHNGGTNSNALDFTQIEAPGTTDAAIRALFSSANAAIDYNATSGVFTFTLDPAATNDASITAGGLLVDVSAGAITDTNNQTGGGAGGATDVQTILDSITTDLNTLETGFLLAADTGTAETVAAGNTVTIAGGTNIASVVSATDTVTLNWAAAISDLSNVPALPTAAGSYSINYDQATDTITWATGSADLHVFGADLPAQTATRNQDQGAFDQIWNGTGTFSLGSATAGPSRLNVTGDVEVIGAAQGLILASADGTRYKINVMNNGIITSNPV